MASQPVNPLPRRTVARRGVVPATSTPAHPQVARLTNNINTGIASEASIANGNGSFGSPGISEHGQRSTSGSPSVSLLDLDQHNNSSLTLSPRQAPRNYHKRHRDRVASGSQARDRSSLGLGDTTGLPLSGLARNNVQSTSRRIVSTPLQNGANHHPPARQMHDNTASTSGILGANGSIIERSSSPSLHIGEDSEATGLTIAGEIDAGELSDASSTSTSASWALIDRMRIWRNDAMNQHLHNTAIFWGSKAFSQTRDPNDGFWLAQAYFAAGMFSRAEKVLTGSWEIRKAPSSGREAEDDEQARRRREKGKGRQDDADGMHLDEDRNGELNSSLTEKERPRNQHPPQVTFADSQTSTIQPRLDHLNNADHDSTPPETVRLADISVACRYLAAQAMVKQEKWSAAMEMLGEVNPFKGGRGKSKTAGAAGASRESGDGGIKFEASMCHLRGMVQLHLNAADRAKECFMEALSIDVKCYDSFEALVSGSMMDVEEEWNFIQGLAYRQHTPEDAEFIRMMYTIRLKKYAHREEMERCGQALTKEYGLLGDPDVLFGLADELYSAMRYADCYAVTSKILRMHDAHAATLPLHLACMQHLPHLRSKLFLLSHELVDREPEAVTSWYAVGLWYYSGKRWEEARRYFGKALLLDNRFGPAWIAFAHSFALEGEHDQAITAYSTAQRHFQGTHLPLMFIGMQYLLLSNIKAADEYLDAAWTMCQTDPLLLNERGVAAYYNEKYEDAVRLLTSALHHAESVQASPTAWASTHLNLGQAYRKLGRFEEAVQSLNRALGLDPRNAQVYAALGTSLMYIDRKEDAIQAFHEALSIQPGEPTATSLLKIALHDALHDHPKSSGSMNFPLLSDVLAEDMDARVAEDERMAFGRVLPNAVGEDRPSATKSAMPVDPRHTRGSRVTRSSRRRQQELHNNSLRDAQDEFIPDVTAASATPMAATASQTRLSLSGFYDQDGQEENENEDSTDSNMIEASQESDMID